MPTGDSNSAFQTSDATIGRDSAWDSVPRLIAAVGELANRLETLHEQHRLHLRISHQTATRNEHGQLQLPPPRATETFGGDLADEELCPFALRTPSPITIPTQFAGAARALHEARISLPPEAIDIYQLTTLLCRLLTGESISSYLRSPRTKSQVPREVQEVIERGLRCGENQAFHNLTEFAEALARTGASMEKEPQSTSGASMADTAPSVFSQKPEGDTSLLIPSRRESVPREPGIPFQRLGHYEIQERIGQGGMGQVYKGYEPTLDRTVAIKVLPAELSRSENFVRRFYAEATAAAKLLHPHIIQIYFIGEDQGHHYFAMQYVQGESLADVLATQGKLDLTEALSVMQQALLGLAAAHKVGLIHRDIKPGNLLLDARSRKVYLADFGLVKSLDEANGLTATGTIMGTVDYISPEQGRGLPVDARTDLYSLGVVLYRMLTGRLPFEADNATSMIFQHAYETPPPLRCLVKDLPEAYSRIVDRLLAKEPQDRYPSAEAVLDDLKAAPLRLSPAQGVAVSQEDKSSSPPLPSRPQSRFQLGTTQLIAVPDFGASPALPNNLDAVAPTGWWPRLQNRFLDYVSKQAPELYNQMQSTEQQVDRAVAVYERRERKLRELAHEAQSVSDGLTQQLKEWKQAAQQRESFSSNAESGPDASCQPHDNQAAMAELAVQIAQQREQSDEILRQLHQVEAKRVQLVLQRDLLKARLKVAHARLEVAGGKPDTRRRGWASFLSWLTQRPPKAVILGSLGAALLVMFLVLFSQKPIEDKVREVLSSPPPSAITNSINMSLVLIPQGEFLMGATAQQRAEASRIDGSFPLQYSADEEPQHLVRITKPFYMSQHEVTREQFAAFVKDSGYKTEAEMQNEAAKDTPGSAPIETWRTPEFPQEDNHPVVCITWNDAVRFCQWLSEKEGVTCRLPTEAEWEYACRAGATTHYQNGDDPEKVAELGNVADKTLTEEKKLNSVLPNKSENVRSENVRSMAIASSDGYAYTAPVGRYRPNAFGLYDMHGNVVEWCSDWFGENYYRASPKADPQGPRAGVFRCFRGGHWFSTPGFCRMADRSRYPPNHIANRFGIRVVQELPAGKPLPELDHAKPGSTKWNNQSGLSQTESPTQNALCNPGALECDAFGVKTRERQESCQHHNLPIALAAAFRRPSIRS